MSAPPATNAACTARDRASQRVERRGCHDDRALVFGARPGASRDRPTQAIRDAIIEDSAGDDLAGAFLGDDLLASRNLDNRCQVVRVSPAGTRILVERPCSTKPLLACAGLRAPCVIATGELPHREYAHLDVDTGAVGPAFHLDTHPAGYFSWADLSPDGRWLAVAHAPDDSIGVIDVVTKTRRVVRAPGSHRNARVGTRLGIIARRRVRATSPSDGSTSTVATNRS
jgi:hypothetical protein